MEEIIKILKELDWSPLFISLKTGVAATIVSFFLGIFAARKAVKASPRKKAVIDGILTLPMVLPPTAAAIPWTAAVSTAAIMNIIHEGCHKPRTQPMNRYMVTASGIIMLPNPPNMRTASGCSGAAASSSSSSLANTLSTNTHKVKASKNTSQAGCHRFNTAPKHM